jgi:hypothetical protein
MVADSTWRVIAQRVLTGEFLSWELPLTGATRSRELSGPGGVYGTINPELQHVLADDGLPLIEEWRTALYIEEAGEIRAGGIVQTVSGEGPALTVNAPGFSSYPTGMPIVSDYTPADFEDPAVVVKNLWTQLQSFPDGNLGLTVNTPRDSHGNFGSTYMVLSNGTGPYKVSWWEFRDYGEELNNILQACPMDYTERHVWNSSHDTIQHYLDLGFPRCGTRRADLRLAESENVVSFAPIAADGQRFSNEVHVVGSGEGSTMIHAVNAVRDGRLRRPTVVARKAATQGLADMFAANERRARELKLDIAEVQIIDHPNARLGQINPGDDLPIEVEVPWFGDVRMWLRVLAIEESVDDPGRATLKTQRADFFSYASATNLNPDGSKAVITL